MERKINQRNRDRKIRPKNNILVIGCEGKNQTEKNYFKNYITRNFTVKFSCGDDTDPLNILENLLKYLENEGIDLTDGNQAYLIFDIDTNNNKQKQIEEAIKVAKQRGIQIAISIPSFEIWYLLHFEYTTKYFTTNKKLINELNKNIDEYNKNMNVYKLIETHTEKAIKNSKKLEAYHQELGQDLTHVSCNPYTSVYKVIEYIQQQKK